MTTLTVDLDAIAANWRQLRAQHAHPTAAVVKADAYGLGATRVAPRLHAEGARHFFVAYPHEGAALRPHLAQASIAVLNGFFPDQAELYLAHALTPVLGNLTEIAAYTRLATTHAARLPAYIHIDTGMNRLGLDPAELAHLTATPALLAAIAPTYVMTHLANAECADDPRNHAQAQRLRDAAALLPQTPRSLANSSAIFLGPDFASSLARPGAATYGINPTPGRPNPMRPVMRLTARVLQIRMVPAGQSVGYNAIWTATRLTRVATVSAGYADGYHRALSNPAPASQASARQASASQASAVLHTPGAAPIFDAPRLPLIGRVSMDLATFDATDHPEVIQGSELELIGPAIPPDEVAAWAHTNGYEILTSLKPRLARIYAAL